MSYFSDLDLSIRNYYKNIPSFFCKVWRQIGHNRLHPPHNLQGFLPG